MGFLGVPLSIRGHFYLERKLRFCAEIFPPKKHPPIICSPFFSESRISATKSDIVQTPTVIGTWVSMQIILGVSTKTKGTLGNFPKMVQEVTCCTTSVKRGPADILNFGENLAFVGSFSAQKPHLIARFTFFRKANSPS